MRYNFIKEFLLNIIRLRPRSISNENVDSIYFILFMYLLVYQFNLI